MNAKQLAEKIWRLLFPQQNINQVYLAGLESLLSSALEEAFNNGRLDAQYDTNTLPEQIEAFKKRTKANAYEECAKICEGWIPFGILGEPFEDSKNQAYSQKITAKGIAQSIRQRAAKLRGE